MTSDAVIWHDVECAAYDLDLPLWRELAERAGGSVLDIGAGTGRVAIDLARHGHDVTGLDADPELVHELSARARKRGVRVRTVAADARSFDLGRTYALAIAPMQVVQLLGGEQGRRAALACVRRHLEPGGLFAAALADPFEGIPEGEAVPPLPDIRDVDGWVYSSTPVAVRREQATAAIDRHRQSVSPTGQISEWMATIELDLVSAAELEAEADEHGFRARPRGWIPDTAEWTGSTVVMLEAA
ncbi:MAG TPA: class I SAM-dependent methyltransferase [Thermoleophilaceae bacterium]|nr:class I SAM-dependent methyltransferase [Thermoleophilaceae bacterium]